MDVWTQNKDYQESTASHNHAKSVTTASLWYLVHTHHMDAARQAQLLTMSSPEARKL